MKFDELRNFIINKRRPVNTDQPLLIKNLAESGGSATIRQLAITCMQNDEDQLLSYEKRLMDTSLGYLASHGVIKKEGNLVSLEAGELTREEKAEIETLCEQKMRDAADFQGATDQNFDRNCVFCNKLKAGDIILENDYSFAVLDRHPVTDGHTLVIPKRHFPDYFEATRSELNAMHDLLKTRKRELTEADPTIKGFNVGSNVGKYAGQSIFHVHIHLIPRRMGDSEDPKGGIRGVIPGRMSY